MPTLHESSDSTDLRRVIDIRDESTVVAYGLRDAASLCTSGQAALAERLKLGASVIDSLLRERSLLLKRVQLAEFQARTNKQTIERMTNEQIRVAVEDAMSLESRA